MVDVKGGSSGGGGLCMRTMVFWRWFSVSSSDLWASNSSVMLFSFWVFSLVRLASLILSFCIWALIGGEGGSILSASHILEWWAYLEEWWREGTC